jgi:DNA-binding CsgD family transcriptional regulator/PAS domain-containing protein
MAGQQPSESRLIALRAEEIVGTLELALLLVELEGFTIRAISGAALRRIGLASGDLIGTSVFELASPEDRHEARVALEAIRDGVIDFCRAHRVVAAVDEGKAWDSEWVRAVELDGVRLALVEVSTRRAHRQSPIVQYLGHEPVAMAIGSTDAELVIMSVSEDVVEILGVPPTDLVGSPLVGATHSDEVERLFELARLDQHGGAVALSTRFADAAGSARELCCILTSLVGTGAYCFVLVPIADADPGARTDRAAQLEAHLRRIAAEVEASGILQNVSELPNPSLLPTIGSLSTRQWDVLSRLLRGERVPMIADELFLSQSTVRNYLSAIFEKFGVHSQSDLLRLLRPKDVSPQ